MNVWLLPPALWTLHWLSVRARLRRIGRGCRTVRGALGLLGGLAIFGFWMASFFIQRSQMQLGPRFIRDYVPVGLLAMCVMNLVFSKTGEGVAFRPAEVEFLFPGPFRRRDLLLHRIVGSSLVLLPAGLMFSMFVYPYVSFWLAGFAGLYLALQFVTLFQMVIGLMAGSVRERLFSRARFGTALLVLVAVGASLLLMIDTPAPDAGGRIARFRDTWPAAIVLFPFDVFARTIAADRWGDLAVWGAAGCGINLLLAGLVFRLDLDFREASLNTSRRIQERLQSARTGRLHWMGGAVNVRRLRYLRLPWLYGAGPIASYQLTSALRSAKGLIPFLLFMLAMAGLPMFLIGQATEVSVLPAIAGPGLMFLLILFPQFLQFDFRGDVDRMDLLKTLPLRPVAIACGQLLAPMVCLLAIEAFLIGVIAVSGTLPSSLLLALAPFLPLGNLMVFAIENLIWLLYPYRLAVAGSADVQAMVRQMLMMVLKMLCFGLVFGTAAGIGATAWLITDSIAAGILVAWAACAAICAVLISLVAWAFARFDPAIDSPA